MKIISVKSGDNKIGFSASLGANSADCVCKSIDIVSDTDGSVTVNRKVAGLSTITVPVTTVTVTSNVGAVASLNVPICAGDTITVSGSPVEGSAKYSVRLICD